jgi:general secretion pathway protein G
VTASRAWKWIVCGIVLVGAIALVFRFATKPLVYSNELKARADIGSIFFTALEAFKRDQGRYPTREESLDVLVDPSPRGRYLISHHAITDPWGHTYVYRPPDPHQQQGLVLYSIGPNGIDEGGKGDDIVPRDQYATAQR